MAFEEHQEMKHCQLQWNKGFQRTVINELDINSTQLCRKLKSTNLVHLGTKNNMESSKVFYQVILRVREEIPCQYQPIFRFVQNYSDCLRIGYPAKFHGLSFCSLLFNIEWIYLRCWDICPFQTQFHSWRAISIVKLISRLF